MHLALNSVILLSLGKFVSIYIGATKTMLVLFLSAVRGAACFGLISSSSAPMIGASGAVFGLIGLWQAMNYRLRRRSKLPVRPVVMAFLGLIVQYLNLPDAFGRASLGSASWRMGCWLDFGAKLRTALRISGVDMLPLWPLILRTVAAGGFRQRRGHEQKTDQFRPGVSFSDLGGTRCEKCWTSWLTAGRIARAVLSRVRAHLT